MGRILVGDARMVLGGMPADHFHAVVTSPPYWGLRKYAAPDSKWGSWTGQLGAEPTPEMYISHLLEVCRHIRRVLRPDGTFWLNLGDSYAVDSRGNNHPMEATSGVSAKRQSSPSVEDAAVSFSVPKKSLLMIPHRVALALQADGWIVRASLPWLKRNGMPQSVKDRPTVGVEYVFMLTKRAAYYYDAYAVRYPARDPGRFDGKTPPNYGARQVGVADATYSGNAGQNYEDRGLRCADLILPQIDATAKGLILDADSNEPLVMDVTTRGFKGAHFAVYPGALVEPLLRLSTSEFGCCQQCGAPCRRIVSSSRKATRPALDSKVAGKSPLEVGNRDPGRHVTHFTTEGWELPCGHSQLPSPDFGGDDPAKMRAGTMSINPCRVLDPFAGSGTTGVVCKALGLDFTGIDVSSDYAAIAQQRLSSKE